MHILWLPCLLSMMFAGESNVSGLVTYDSSPVPDLATTLDQVAFPRTYWTEEGICCYKSCAAVSAASTGREGKGVYLNPSKLHWFGTSLRLGRMLTESLVLNFLLHFDSTFPKPERANDFFRGRE